MEEISELLQLLESVSWTNPVFSSINGYYDAMKTMLDTMVAHDFFGG